MLVEDEASASGPRPATLGTLASIVGASTNRLRPSSASRAASSGITSPEGRT